MPSSPERLRPRRWVPILTGGLSGGVIGVVSGPLAMIAVMWFMSSYYGARSLGLELLAAPMLGVVCGAVEGACLGAIWAYIGRRKYHMTIRGLMWIVAISGPGLAFVIAFPMVALFALANAAVALPFALMEAIAVTSAREET